DIQPPIADYEGLPISTLQHRVRSLDAEQMRTLIAYEESHADRTGVLEILKNRLQQLEEGAQPSEGDQSFQPETPGPPEGGSQAGADTTAPISNTRCAANPTSPSSPRAVCSPARSRTTEEGETEARHFPRTRVAAHTRKRPSCSPKALGRTPQAEG